MSKIVPFNVCNEQLSPELHYNFGLCALKAMLANAGILKCGHLQNAKAPLNCTMVILDKYQDKLMEPSANNHTNAPPSYETITMAHSGQPVTVRGHGLVFSILHLPPITDDSPFTFTILVIFFANTF